VIAIDFFGAALVAAVRIIAEVRLSSANRYTAEFTPETRLKADAATLALWHLDEGAGSVADDSGPAQLQGTIVGAAWALAPTRSGAGPSPVASRGQPAVEAYRLKPPPLQLSWLPQSVLQLPLPLTLQWKVQPPPGQVKVQLAPSEQVMSQPPPAQSRLHVDWSLHVEVQSPEAQVESHVAVPLQTCVHLEPPVQACVHSLVLPHVLWHSASF